MTNDDKSDASYQPLLNQYSDSVQTPPAPPQPPKPVIASEAKQSLPEKSISSKNPFKFIFFVSLFIFLVILGSIILSFYQQSQTDGQSLVPTTIPTAISPTQPEDSFPAGSFCLLNDEQYEINQSFPAADGCNTCTCLPSLIISCTNDDCNQQP